VEARVEDGDVRNVREHEASFLEGGERRRVVEWRQRDERLELALDLRVDQDGLTEPLAAVDDPVPDRADGGNGRQRLDRRRLVVLSDDRELEARRAGVDD